MTSCRLFAHECHEHIPLVQVFVCLTTAAPVENLPGHLLQDVKGFWLVLDQYWSDSLLWCVPCDFCWVSGEPAEWLHVVVKYFEWLWLQQLRLRCAAAVSHDLMVGVCQCVRPLLPCFPLQLHRDEAPLIDQLRHGISNVFTQATTINRWIIKLSTVQKL